MKSGKVWAFGKETHGRLGLGLVTRSVYKPM